MKAGAIIGILIGVSAIGATSILVYRNRQPKLITESLDWLKKKGQIKFGSTVNPVSLSGGLGMTAGSGYDSRYGATIGSDDGKTNYVRVIDNKNGSIVKEIIIDWDNKKVIDKIN